LWCSESWQIPAGDTAITMPTDSCCGEVIGVALG